MGEKTLIEWCDSTCNPAPCCMGCELFPKNCYAYAVHRRHDGKTGWPQTFTSPALFLDRIKTAAKWRDLRGRPRPHKPWLNGMPRLIFLNDIGDTFAPFDGAEFSPELHWLHPYLHTIEQSPHVWLLLTKWPERFAEFARHAGGLPENLWGGTTVTSQAVASRVDTLLQIDLSFRFLVFEPLLGPVAVRLHEATCRHCGRPVDGHVVGLRGKRSEPFSHYCHRESCFEQMPLASIDWVVAGGESGPMARPAHPDWFRLIRDGCQAAGVPFFFKQWGEWVPQVESTVALAVTGNGSRVRAIGIDGKNAHAGNPPYALMARVEKKTAGRQLDGVEWNQVPGLEQAQ